MKRSRTPTFLSLLFGAAIILLAIATKIFQ